MIDTGMNALTRIDEDVARAFKEFGTPAPRLRKKGFETFLSIIISQQISTEVARAILRRVTDLLPENSANALLSLNDQDLRDAGMSYRKIEYTKGLAQAVQDGRFDIEALETMTDAEAINSISALRGFGR